MRFLPLLLLLTTELFAQPVARVGDRDITTTDVQNYIDNTDASLSPSLRRIEARERLIRSALLSTYADRDHIDVSDDELEQYIRADLSESLPVFSDGVFDEDKYAAVRDSSAFAGYFEDLLFNLRLRKVESLIKAGFDLDDDSVQRQYIRESYRLDLSYVLINDEMVNVPDSLDPETAWSDYLSNRERELKPGNESRKITFPGPPPATFGPFPGESWTNLSMASGRLGKNLLNAKPEPEIAHVACPPTIGTAGTLAWKQYVRKSTTKPINFSDAKTWYLAHRQDYIEKARLTRIIVLNPETIKYRTSFGEADLKEWYKKHPDNYKTNGKRIAYDACRSKVIDDMRANERDETVTIVKAKLATNIQDDTRLDIIVRDYGLVSRVDSLLSVNYTGDSVGYAVANKVFAREDGDDTRFGVIPVGKQTFAYRVIGDVDYLPPFSGRSDKVMSAYRKYRDQKDDRTDYRAFYEDIRGDFVVPDSLTISVAWFPVEPDTASISQQEIDEAWESRHSEYWLDDGFLYDACFIGDPGLKNQVSDFRDQLVSISPIADYFGRPEGVNPNLPVAVESIPEPIRSALLGLPTYPTDPRQTITHPLRYQGGWIIAQSKKRFQDSYIPENLAKADLKRRMAYERALDLVINQAASLLPTSSKKNSSKPAPTPKIIELPRQDMAEPFPYIGDLMPYRPDLLRLSDGQPLNRVIATNEGCAVVYLVSRNRVKPTSYTALLPLLKQAWREEQFDRNTRAFVNGLVSDLRDGDNPEKTLPCLGDWWSVTNLTPADSLPGIPNSNRIIADLRNRKAGEYMPPVKATPHQYLLLRIDRVQKGGRDDYEQRHDAIRDQMLEHRFRRWLTDYEREIGVVRF
jgi:hypothetical protein